MSFKIEVLRQEKIKQAFLRQIIRRQCKTPKIVRFILTLNGEGATE